MLMLTKSEQPDPVLQNILIFKIAGLQLLVVQIVDLLNCTKENHQAEQAMYSTF